jgi:hypothetical protein
MGEAIRFRPVDAFDPEGVGMLSAALEIAWRQIEKSGSRFARPAYAHVTREVVAKRIIEMAKQGEQDPHSLAEDAVSFLAANYWDIEPDSRLNIASEIYGALCAQYPNRLFMLCDERGRAVARNDYSSYRPQPTNHVC